MKPQPSHWAYQSDGAKLNSGREYVQTVTDDQRDKLWLLFYSSGPVSGGEYETHFRTTALCDAPYAHFLGYGIPYDNEGGIVVAQHIIDRIAHFRSAIGLSIEARWAIIDPPMAVHILALYLLLQSLNGANNQDRMAVVSAWDRMDKQWKGVFWNNLHHEYLRRKPDFDRVGDALTSLANRFGCTTASDREVSLEVYCTEVSHLDALEQAMQFTRESFRRLNSCWEVLYKSYHTWLQNGVLCEIDAWLKDPTIELVSLSDGNQMDSSSIS